MRSLLLSCCLLSFLLLANPPALAEENSPINLATHVQTEPPEPAVDSKAIDTNSMDTKAIERIRQIVLNQGEDARALANLVQLARNLPAADTCQLYYELSTDYLELGRYNQAASVLQQVLNQHAQEPLSRPALLRLVRLFTSSEATHTQNDSQDAENLAVARAGFARYGNHLASSAIVANQALAGDPALTFQRAIALRHQAQDKAALGALTRLKRDLHAEPWRTRALMEGWLAGDRKDEPPLAVLPCPRSEEHPHLDGVLDDPLWNADKPVQFAYNEDFLYVAITYPKHASLDYSPDDRPRTYDADLSAHDRVRLLLDVDRDYATGYELTVDHRGWTNDRCWLETAWNPKWFVAASGSTTHWSVEAAIPFEALANPAPQSGDAWVISAQRLSPSETDSPQPQPQGEDFQLMLFQ